MTVAQRLNILDLGDLSIRMHPVSIERFGEQEILQAYKNHPNCPYKVRIALYAAGEPIRALTDDSTDVEQAQAEYEARRDSLLAVINGLDFHEAEVLAGLSAASQLVLHELGWEREDDDDDTPPVLALPSIGGAYCLNCQQSITDPGTSF